MRVAITRTLASYFPTLSVVPDSEPPVYDCTLALVTDDGPYFDKYYRRLSPVFFGTPEAALEYFSRNLS